METAGDGYAGTAKKLMKDYLLQDEDVEAGRESRYKILLTKGDRDTFMRLIDGREIDLTKAPRLIETYNLFVEQLRKIPLALEEVVADVEKLLIVDIALERDHDNPQLIFESLNSTGLDLSQADLIRNYVLMGQPAQLQHDIYTNSWYPLDRLLLGLVARANDGAPRRRVSELTLDRGDLPGQHLGLVYVGRRRRLGVLHDGVLPSQRPLPVGVARVPCQTRAHRRLLSMNSSSARSLMRQCPRGLNRTAAIWPPTTSSFNVFGWQSSRAAATVNRTKRSFSSTIGVPAAISRLVSVWGPESGGVCEVGASAQERSPFERASRCCPLCCPPATYVRCSVAKNRL